MRLILFAILLMGWNAQAQSSSEARLADDLFLQGRYEEAVVAYERLPQAEKTAPVLNRLAVSYHLLSRLPQAENTYKRAIRADSGYAVAYNNLGALYYYQHKFGDADNEFRRAAERDPSNDLLRRNIQMARYARENSRAARTAAATLTQQHPFLVAGERGGGYFEIVPLLSEDVLAQVQDLEMRGDLFMARKMYEDAIIEYGKLVALDRFNSSVINRIGIAYHNLDMVRDAERQYREVLRINPYFLEALNNLGVLEYARQNFESALDYYGRALRIQPQSPTILHNLGACFFSMERYVEGVQAYQLALEIDPELFDRMGAAGAGTLIQLTQHGSSMLNFHLARIFAERGDIDRAMSYLYRAVEAGFADPIMLEREPAFVTLGEDQRFGQLLERLKSVG